MQNIKNIKNLVKQIIDKDLLDHGIDILLTKSAHQKFTTGSSLTKQEQLANLSKKSKNCQACQLCKTRNNVIFGEGSADAKLMFVAESPWQEEDETGKTFLGEKGELFNKILKAIKLDREKVYITDIVKCYPTEHDGTRRTPTKSEINECIKILHTQINIIKPKIIVPLGNTASRALLNTDKEITQTRGQIYKYKDIESGPKIIPTFHPAFLLRKPQAKKLAWEDMQKIRDLLK